MATMIRTQIVSAWRWLARRPGYMLLTADEGRLAAEPGERFRHAWAGLMCGSLAWGLANTVVWGAAWRVFGGYTLLLLPSLAMLTFVLLWPGRQAAAALAEALAGGKSALRPTMAALIVLVLAGSLLALQPDWYRSEYALPQSIAWIRPQAKFYRVLILMPLWGGWSMLIVCQFRKPDPTTTAPMAAFARGCGPFVAAACLALPLAGSIFYFSYLPWTQLSISGAAVFAAIVGGLILCPRNGGPSRNNVLATNLLTQIVFVLACLANR